MYQVHGISTCEKCLAAQGWLDGQQISYEFNDFSSGIESDKLDNWLTQVSWEELVNKDAEAWQALSEEEQPQGIEAARQFILQHPVAMQRPIVEDADGNVVVYGFEKDDYYREFGRIEEEEAAEAADEATDQPEV